MAEKNEKQLASVESVRWVDLRALSDLLF